MSNSEYNVPIIVVITVCSNQDTAPGILTSHGYPENYANNVNFSQCIESTASYTLLFVVALETESNADFLEVCRLHGGSFFTVFR